MLSSGNNFYNLTLHRHDTASALSECRKFLQGEKNCIVIFINSHCFNTAQQNSLYRNIVNSADLVLNDGIGIKIASKLNGFKIKENMNGTDFIPRIVELAIEEGKKLFLLGGKRNIAEKAKSVWEKKYPEIQITGTHDGYFTEEDEPELISEINRSGAEILIIGMGVPRQEIWLYKQKEKLTNVRITVAGGAILDFTSGRIKRAPKFIRQIGMEWFFRLINEPKRLFKRYTIGNIMFFLYLVKFLIIRKTKH